MPKYSIRTGDDDGETYQEFVKARESGDREIRASDLIDRRKLSYLLNEEGLSLKDIAMALGLDVSMVRACAEWHGLRRRPGHAPTHKPWKRYTPLIEALREERNEHP